MIKFLLVLFGSSFLLTSCKYHSNWGEYLDSRLPHRPQMIYTDLKKEIDSHGAGFVESNQSKVVYPQIVKQGMLKYPPKLVLAGIEGEARFLVKIKKDGSVEELGLLCYNHEAFIEPARQAILTSKYERIEEEMTFFLPVRFSLMSERLGICEVHGDVTGIFSHESGFYVCPLCYPESLPPRVDK